MTGGRTTDDCQSELVVEARRGTLGPAGALALEAHLAACGSCRLGRELGADFDESDRVDAGDGERLQRLAVAARGWADAAAGHGWRFGRSRARNVRAGTRGWTRAAAAAAALAVGGGSASAAIWLWHRRAPVADPAVERAMTAPRRPRMAIETAAPRALPPPVAREISLLSMPGLAPPGLPPSTATAASQERAPLRAPSLLRAAGEARSGGAFNRAIVLYRRLQRAFPASPEAELAAVPLGRLLLDDGAPRAALAEFDRYLAVSATGTLAPEALFGRARSLGRLGERDEERRTWQRLLTDFPGSPYVSFGKRRLAELE